MRIAFGVGLILFGIGVAVGGQAGPKSHTVTIEGMRFQPEIVTVAVGDTIIWVNKDLVPHTATATAGSFDSKNIQSDKSWRYTPGTAGEFAYICTFHPTMKATLRVR